MLIISGFAFQKLMGAGVIMNTSKKREQREKEIKTKWKFHDGENIKDDKRNLTILAKETKDYLYGNYIYKQKWYKLLCNKCGYDSIYIDESHLSQGRGCPVCSGRKVAVGINDINTTANWMLQYIKNKEDGSLYTKTSNSYIDFKCPDCGDISSQKISNVYNFGFRCKNCRDGISYPNKFSYEFLRQLPVQNVCHEYIPDWGNGKRYDNYFEYDGEKYILEMDGGFHYQYNTLNKKTADEEQKNDYIKDLLAKNHSITVIRIKSVKNELNYMKEQFESNDILNSMFDLSNIDFKKCHEFAMSNLSKEVCDYYNHCQSVNGCIEKFGLARITILTYLKNGYVLGWGDYTPQKSYKQRSLNRKSKSISIIKDGEEIIYDSTKQLCFDIKHKFGIDLKVQGVRNAARENIKYKKCIFRYV